VTAHPLALVTGGRRGIGRGIAFALADAGFDLAISDLARDADMAATLDGLAARGAAALAHAADLADLASHAPLLDAVWQRFGRLDCLVNNAGVSALHRGDLLDVAPESYDLNFAVNTRAGFFLTQAAAKRMLAAEPRGAENARSIFFVSSVNAAIVAVERGEYCLSKTAVSMMAKLFATRLAPHGIAVHEIRPGLIATDMTAVARPRYDVLLADGLTPINRWGTPADVGRAVASLASGALPFTTGAAFTIDGGMHLHRL
jgi:NAD(P)-dependent dehydrogenase (short-subunit alcohol dehydrogenase family)